MSRLWEKVSYRSPVQFLLDTQIIEYDISKANINVLFDAGVLALDQYNYFMNCPKIERSIAIGKMQGRDPNITAVLKSGIANARKVFIEQNNISDSSILAIRNDAITIIGDNPIYNLNITDNVKFRIAGVYRSYYNLNNIEYFYNYDLINKIEILDIKGLGDISISLHKDYMLDFFKELFYTAQIEGVKNAISLLQSVYDRYIKRELSVNYYRELNSESRYRFIGTISRYSSITTDNATNFDKDILDVGFNENVLRYLTRIYASIYFGMK